MTYQHVCLEDGGCNDVGHLVKHAGWQQLVLDEQVHGDVRMHLLVRALAAEERSDGVLARHQALVGEACKDGNTVVESGISAWRQNPPCVSVSGKYVTAATRIKLLN